MDMEYIYAPSRASRFHAHAVYLCCMLLLRFHAACPCCMSIMPVHAACPTECSGAIFGEIFEYKQSLCVQDSQKRDSLRFFCRSIMQRWHFRYNLRKTNNFVLRYSQKARIATIFLLARLAKSESRFKMFLTSLAKISRKLRFWKRVSLFTKNILKWFSCQPSRLANF